MGEMLEVFVMGLVSGILGTSAGFGAGGFLFWRLRDLARADAVSLD